MEGCEGVPYAHDAREIWVAGADAVDGSAHFWMLDRPKHYRTSAATTRYRVGSGIVRVDAQLSEGDLRVPFSKQAVLNEIHQSARVVEEKWDEDGAHLRVRAEPATLSRLQAMLSR